jgi:acetate CoA/acetoacetate CoA-transferase alpha subunit
MQKVASSEEIANTYFHDGMTVMIGGFLGIGCPDQLINLMIEKGIKNMTLISSDTGMLEKGVGPLILNKRVKKGIVSHIGTNPETGRQLIANEITLELVPQGTLVERIRAGGSGLGGVLTPTGVGTMVEEGKQKIIVGENTYLLELPLRCDVALIKAYKADKLGNLIYQNTARNFNPIMAMAADHVIVEVEEIVEVGQIPPVEVMTPGILVDKIFLQGGETIESI